MAQQKARSVRPARELVNAGEQLRSAIAAELRPFGGVLRCMTCGDEHELADISGHLATGWPSCCGHTMRWITDRQLRGEVPL